jgi:hypothetical protein
MRANGKNKRPRREEDEHDDADADDDDSLDLTNNRTFLRSLANALSHPPFIVEYKHMQNYNHCGYIDLVWEDQHFFVLHSYQNVNDGPYREYSNESYETRVNASGQFEFELEVKAAGDAPIDLLNELCIGFVRFFSDHYSLGAAYVIKKNSKRRLIRIRGGAEIASLAELSFRLLKASYRPEDVVKQVPDQMLTTLFKIKWK